MYPDDFLQRKLQERKDAHAFRKLSLPGSKVDFCSNDYLGLSGIMKAGSQGMVSGYSPGSTGSRLLSGNYSLMEETEKEIAAFHEADTALLFNSGYDANVGLLSCVPQKGDTILFDRLCHASIRDGIRLSFADAYAFAHNNMDDLQKKMAKSRGNCFIVTESVFSMNGDTCPIQQLTDIAAAHGAHLVIDEAHATGVVGNRGEGLVQMYGLQDRVFARVHTFGKACGCHGAVVLGSAALRDYLINFARSFVFTTALPEQAVAHIRRAYHLFPGMTAERQQLRKLIDLFRQTGLPYEKLDSHTPIQGIIVPGNEQARALAASVQAKGFDVRPILYPTVPEGRERLRIVLHSFNSHDELLALMQCLQEQ